MARNPNQLQEYVLQCIDDSIDVLERTREIVPPVFHVAQQAAELAALPNLIRDNFQQQTATLNRLSRGITLINMRLNRQNTRFNVIDTRLNRMHRSIIGINGRINDLTTRIDQVEQNSLVRARNATCMHDNSVIAWYRVGIRDLPHRCRTINQFYRLNENQLVDFLNYYNLPVQGGQVANRRTLGRLLGLPAFV